MNALFTVFLTLHIIGGAVGLFTGTINLVRKKGDRKHKLIGRLFVYGMLTAGVSSLVLSFIHPNYFLFIVGVFTIYLVFTGNRYLRLRMLGSNQRPKPLDWTVTIAMLLTGFLFVGLGIEHLFEKSNFGIVFIVFGLLGLRLVIADFKNYKGQICAKNYWLLSHLQRMVGAYIAAATAFLVVNADYFPKQIPSLVYWLLPTAILFPLIISWTRKYRVENKW